MAEADPRAIYNVHHAKTHLSKLIDRAHLGEEIILAKAGEPWAKIVPYAVSIGTPRKPGRFAHLLKDVPSDVWFEPLSDDELDAWEGRYSNII